ncbi:hypothetical protein HOLleu_43365 [Holothuria leucospilota]|uniref:Ig-like domain-containing protein n=1 Tax=Holothuria leucospilota TaxID=206669 RepID=A0A9Q0YDV9_HOLLE|nr:hypothetical protein HOLleu_43365 [Holothuria leucospilota]
MKQNELQLLLAFTCLAFVNATDKPSLDWPVLVFKEGETAYLPCPPQGHANAFFWRKGEWFNVSENIASIVHGIADTTEKYDVLSDGTLVIMEMSVEDEGKYFCRIASEKNECHGSITLYLEVSAEALDIAIEGCTSSSSCAKVLEPSLKFQLTCTANMISESMTLKWYNGSTEIIGNLDVSETFGKKVKMTNVITFMFEDESYLTCEAEGVNIAKSTAAIQLKKKEVFIPVENEATMTLLVPTIALGIICLILTGILICLIVRYRKPDKEQGKVKDAHSVEMSVTGVEQEEDKKEGQNAEKDSLLTSKGKNDPNLTTSEKELQVSHLTYVN